jgi:hypothetical protein
MYVGHRATSEVQLIAGLQCYAWDSMVPANLGCSQIDDMSPLVSDKCYDRKIPAVVVQFRLPVIRGPTVANVLTPSYLVML